MGAHMANNLVKAGYTLAVNDVNKSSLERLTDRSRVTFYETPKEVAAVSDAVVTMLPSSPHVRQVYTSKALRPNTLLMDASTIDPLVAREVSAAAKAKGGLMVDAPVSGGVGGAQNGTLTFMVGGETEGYERAKPILLSMGKNVVHCGPAGNGQVVKLCNNLALAISMVGTAEAMNLGVSYGMDPKLLASIFNTSTARCWSSDTYNPTPGVMEGAVPASRGYTGGFAVDLMTKDLGLAVDAAHSGKVPLLIGEQILSLYHLIQRHGEGSKDFSYVYEFLQTLKKIRRGE